MERIQMPQKLQMNTTSVSDIRCPNCSRQLVIKDNREFCFYCEVIAPEDKKISAEVSEWVKNREINELLASFKENSLMNRDLEQATFDNYKPQNDSQANALTQAKDYVAEFDKTSGIVFQGRPGLGKSHIAAAISKEVIQKKYTSIFISLPRLMTELQATYNKNSQTTELELLKALQKVDLLILDDLGVERTQKEDNGFTWAKRKIYEIVDSRIGQATIYTTNFSGKELLQMYGERDFSRIVQNCQAIKIDGSNYRLQAFK
ncbi:DNA replication protein DnaC [Cytobacillus horneckiae]|uniref:ATP-binding protein n=1 Tax=Cytobacillus horneckiae TaxID=549687 RepID=UPI0019CFE0D3|nr:ATP-binding protein [Cytobacillus horneckiae]MBN6886999.1 ATP-binding protein [Cytobacillus horneckiae]